VGAVTGKGTVPQIFIDGNYIGGADELEQWARDRNRKAA
jgi:glutaredoxin